jgi:pimeloyl-ACP methyl ester carboxylesterase
MPVLYIHDLEINYDVIGHGPPLLLIHGLGSSGRDWEKQIDSFAKEFRVITFDLRGHGLSGKPPGPYSIGMFANDTLALIAALKIAPLHMVGISMGGMVAFELAVGYPEILRSLTIVNSYPEMRVETLREHLQVWRRFLSLEVLGMRGTGVILGRHLFPKPDQNDLRGLFVTRWSENDKSAYREALRAILNWDVEAQLGEIRCPVMVVASDQDYMPLEEKQAYVAKIPNAKLVVIEDARHAVTVEKPEHFNAILEKFLAGVERQID